MQHRSALKLFFFVVFGMALLGFAGHLQSNPVQNRGGVYEGKPGQDVEISLKGSGFSQAKGVKAVKIGDLEVEVLEYHIESDRLIRVKVRIPTDAKPGLHKIAILIASDLNETWLQSDTYGKIAQGDNPKIELLDGHSRIENGQANVIQFPTTTVGSPVTKKFRINNPGNATLILSNVQVPAGFSLAGSFPDSIEADNATFFEVRLAAQSANTFSGNLQFDNNVEDASPFKYQLAGRVGPVPDIEIKVSDRTISVPVKPVDFGTTTGTAVSKVFAIRNMGSDTLKLSNLQLPSGFSVDAFPEFVDPGDLAFFTVKLNPDGPNTVNGVLQFNHNVAGANPFAIAMQGQIVPPPPARIEVLVDGKPIRNGQLLDLGPMTAASPISKIFTIQNPGSDTLKLTDLQLPAGFRVLGDAPRQIAPKSGATLAIEVQPASPDLVGETFGFTINDQPFSFEIAGNIKPTLPDFDILVGGVPIGTGEAAVVKFDSTTVGSPIRKTFQIHNNGARPLQLQAMQLPPGFSLVGNLPESIAPGRQGDFGIQLDAENEASFGGPVQLEVNDNPYRFEMRGTVAKKASVAKIPPFLLWGGAVLLAIVLISIFGKSYLAKIASQRTLRQTRRTAFKTPAPLIQFKPRKDVGSQKIIESKSFKINFVLRLKPLLDYGKQTLPETHLIVTPATKSKSSKADDLKRIEGIGPKISALLQTSGINTYEQLAAADPGYLRKLLDDAGIRIANPATWPEQAGLASSGNWDALHNLQAELKGGRRVSANLRKN